MKRENNKSFSIIKFTRCWYLFEENEKIDLPNLHGEISSKFFTIFKFSIYKLSFKHVISCLQ